MQRLAVVALVSLLLGCQQSATPESPAVPLGSLTAQLKQKGDSFVARGEYEAAAVKYQAAVNQEPSNVSLHFALGVALSHLGRREETVDQFRFVVSRGAPDSTEVQVARRWLVAAGELAPVVSFLPRTRLEAEARMSRLASSAATSIGGTVKGKTEGAGVREVNLALMGNDSSNRELAFSKRLKLGEPYEFADVPPGNYWLTMDDRDSGVQLWDVPVTVTAGQETVLDLTSTSRATR